MSLIKRSSFVPHPEGLTIGTVADIVLDEEGRYGTQIKWSFDTEESMPDGSPYRINYWTAPTLNEKSNLFRLLKAFGEDPEDPKWEIEEISELDDLLGRKVQLNIIHKAGEQGPVARIDGILPVQRRRAAEARSEEREPVSAGARGAGRSDAKGGASIWKDED